MSNRIYYLKVIGNITNILSAYIKESNIKSLFININGLNSVICAAIARVACENNNISLVGRSFFDKDEDLQNLGGYYCTDYDLIKPIPITDIPLEKEDESEEKKLRRISNIKSRVEMIYMYDMAKCHEGIILDTYDNTDYLMGSIPTNVEYDFSMIRELWKSEVIDMVNMYISIYKENPKFNKKINNFKNMLDKYTSNSLYCNKDVDSTLVKYLQGDTSLESSEVINTYYNAWYKIRKPYIIPRDGLLKSINEKGDSVK